MQKNANRTISIVLYKVKSKWTKDLNIELDTLNIIDVNLESDLEVIVAGDNFLNRTLIAQLLRSPINKWDS